MCSRYLLYSSGNSLTYFLPLTFVLSVPRKNVDPIHLQGHRSTRQPRLLQNFCGILYRVHWRPFSPSRLGSRILSTMPLSIRDFRSRASVCRGQYISTICSGASEIFFPFSTCLTYNRCFPRISFQVKPLRLILRNSKSSASLDCRI